MADSELLPQQSSAIAFSGELCIREIRDAHSRLLEALHADRTLTVDIDDDATVDLSFVQLLESARQTARDLGGSIDLARPASGDLLDVLQRGGFVQSEGDRAFWLIEGEAS